MNLSEKIECISDNLINTKNFIIESDKPNADEVLTKFESTIKMLLDGSIAIGDMVEDDLKDE